MTTATHYLPPDITPIGTPGHLRPGHRIRWRDAGPDGQTGGMLVGGDEPPTQWLRTEAGWYVAATPADPASLVRSVLHDYQPVRVAGHDLAVPVLLERTFAAASHLVHTICTLDDEGSPQLVRHIEHADLIDRLRTTLLALARDDCPEDIHLWQLAADVLGVHYHLSLHECAAWRWLDDRTVAQIITTTLRPAPDDDEGGDV